jgi:hypothetical protein
MRKSRRTNKQTNKQWAKHQHHQPDNAKVDLGGHSRVVRHALHVLPLCTKWLWIQLYVLWHAVMMSAPQRRAVSLVILDGKWWRDYSLVSRLHQPDTCHLGDRDVTYEWMSMSTCINASVNAREIVIELNTFQSRKHGHRRQSEEGSFQ